MAEAVAAAGPEPDVVLEATFGWYWAADLLAEGGARVHLAHPLGNNWGNRRVKNDERDATDLFAHSTADSPPWALIPARQRRSRLPLSHGPGGRRQRRRLLRLHPGAPAGRHHLCHEVNGHCTSPARHVKVRELMAGIGRTYGKAEAKRDPLLVAWQVRT